MDVVEPAHGELLRAVAAAQDWGAASRAHATCLATLQSGLLLDVKAVATSLEALFQLALAMHALACGDAGSGDVDAAAPSVTQDAVDELDGHWRRQAGTLMAVLRGPKLGVARTPGWRALLERVQDLVPSTATGVPLSP